MKKTIKILSLISFSSAILSCVLVAVSLTLRWEHFCFLFSASEQFIEIGPVIPAESIAYLLSCVSVSTILVASLKSKKTIVLDILLIAFLSVILPIIYRILSGIQAICIANIGPMKLAAFNVTRKIVGCFSGLIDISKYLCFVICGMRIATTVISKNNDSDLDCIK